MYASPLAALVWFQVLVGWTLEVSGMFDVQENEDVPQIRNIPVTMATGAAVTEP